MKGFLLLSSAYLPLYVLRLNSEMEDTINSADAYKHKIITFGSNDS